MLFGPLLATITVVVGRALPTLPHGLFWDVNGEPIVTHRLVLCGVDTGIWLVHDVDELSLLDKEHETMAASNEWYIILYGRHSGDPTVPGLVVEDDLTQISVKSQQIIPDFNLKGAIKRLRTGNRTERLRILKAIHERFWHAPPDDMINFLKSVAVPIDVLRLVPEVVRSCSICSKFSRRAHSPLLRIELSGHFNFLVEIDLFYLWNLIWLIILDSATRYKVICLVKDKSGKEIMKALIRHWFRYFGPMKVCISDQEGCITSDSVGTNFE